MDCQAIHSWSFTGIVGAFLDLAIAFFLLCGSTLAFFTSKFLGLFGLSLPCPCNGLFGNSFRNNCVPRLLVECPIEKVSSVQHSVKSKFPFDLIWPNAQVKGGERNYDGGHLELEGERRGFDVKGKGVLNQKQRSILRRRRRHAFDSGETSSVSSYDPLTSSAGGAPRSSISINKGDGIDGVSLSLADCGVGEFQFKFEVCLISLFSCFLTWI